MVRDVKNATLVMGKPTYELMEHEKRGLRTRRSLVAVKDIREGEIFSPENVRSIRPAIGLKPKYYQQLIGKKAKKAYKFGEPISEIELR